MNNKVRKRQSTCRVGSTETRQVDFKIDISLFKARAACRVPRAACFMLLALSPALALADEIKIFNTPAGTLNFSTLANKLGALANAIIPFLIGVALIIAIWGIFKYITAAGEAEKRAEGRKVVVWSIIALFIMLAFWGFVIMIRNTLFPQ